MSVYRARHIGARPHARALGGRERAGGRVCLWPASSSATNARPLPRPYGALAQKMTGRHDATAQIVCPPPPPKFTHRRRRARLIAPRARARPGDRDRARAISNHGLALRQAQDGGRNPEGEQAHARQGDPRARPRAHGAAESGEEDGCGDQKDGQGGTDGAWWWCWSRVSGGGTGAANSSIEPKGRQPPSRPRRRHRSRSLSLTQNTHRAQMHQKYT